MIKRSVQHGSGGLASRGLDHGVDEVGGRHHQLSRILGNGRPLTEIEVGPAGQELDLV